VLFAREIKSKFIPAHPKLTVPYSGAGGMTRPRNQKGIPAVRNRHQSNPEKKNSEAKKKRKKKVENIRDILREKGKTLYSEIRMNIYKNKRFGGKRVFPTHTPPTRR